MALITIVIYASRLALDRPRHFESNIANSHKRRQALIHAVALIVRRMTTATARRDPVKSERCTQCVKFLGPVFGVHWPSDAPCFTTLELDPTKAQAQAQYGIFSSPRTCCAGLERGNGCNITCLALVSWLLWLRCGEGREMEESILCEYRSLALTWMQRSNCDGDATTVLQGKEGVSTGWLGPRWILAKHRYQFCHDGSVP